jgi:glycosyltransferase involved in cell wall biosynthesis
MNIALISTSPPYRGGISDHNKGLYNNLSKNHSVQIFSFYYQYPKLLFPGKTQKFSNNKKYLNTHYSISTINPLSWTKTVNSILEFNPDLVIFSYWNPFVGVSLGSIAKQLKRKIGSEKLISICHNIQPHENNIIDTKLIKYYTKPFKKFILMSSFVESELKSFKENYKSVIRFLPIDIKYKPKLDKISIRLEKGYLADDNLILFAGLIRPYKGLDNLLHGVKDYLKNNKNSKLIIAGEAYESLNKYKAIIDEYSINNQVIWIDKFLSSSELEKLMIMCDLLVLPYHSASQSGIISQSWQYNLPTIVNNVGGLSEYVNDNRSGYIIRDNSISSLKEKINQFFNSNDKIEMPQYIASNKQNFSWDHYISGIWELVNES